MLSLDAPNNDRSCRLSGKKTAIKTALAATVTIMPVPIALCAFSDCLRPWQMLRCAAQPSPKHQANACAIIKMGNTTPVAALPSTLSSLRPTNIWSTMLYSALTNKENTQGIENLSISLGIFCVPKNAVFSVSSIKASEKMIFAESLSEKSYLKTAPHKEKQHRILSDFYAVFLLSTVLV